MSYRESIITRLDQAWGAEPIGSHRIPLFGPALLSLRNRSRNLERSNLVASGVLDRTVENVIGSGITVRPKSKNLEWNKAIRKLWRRKTRGKRFDARRMLTWPAMQRAIYRALHRDGDVAILLVDEGYGPELQIIDANSIETPPGRDERTIRDGVELDGRGRPVAYWIRIGDGSGIDTHKRVEWRDLIFYHRSPRADVVRGETTFNGSFRLFEQVDGLAEATVVGARVNAAACMVRKRKRRGGGSRFRDGDTQQQTAETQAGETVAAVDMEPGTIITIDTDADDELATFNPNGSAPQFDAVLRAFGRILGLKFGLTVQRVLLDFTNTNYSVSKATERQEQKFAEPEQIDFVETVLRRVYEWCVAKWARAKLVRDDAGNEIAEPDDAWELEWIPPARTAIDPEKDAKGQKIQVGMNTESYRNIAEGNGYELEDIIADNARDTQLMRDAGVEPTDVFAQIEEPAIEPDENDENAAADRAAEQADPKPATAP